MYVSFLLLKNFQLYFENSVLIFFNHIHCRLYEMDVEESATVMSLKKNYKSFFV